MCYRTEQLSLLIYVYVGCKVLMMHLRQRYIFRLAYLYYYNLLMMHALYVYVGCKVFCALGLHICMCISAC